MVGGQSAQRLQEDISDLASLQMEPALRLEFTVEMLDGKAVMAVEVPGIPPESRPCYYKPAGLQKGSYIRVGNTNRLMTDYEIFGYVSARAQPTFDEELIPNAKLEDLNQERLSEYIKLLKRTRSQASYLSFPFEKILTQLRIAVEKDGALRPTLAGLLMFGNFPQSFEPQLVITFLQYYGTTETEKAPGGERFLDNRKFEGTIPEILENSVNYVLASIRKSSLITGLFRKDIPEYPEEAVREAIVNAVAHRDYSPFVRGSYIQVRLFVDRLEIQSPGGLYGNVTEETLEEEHSTRNRVLMRLMEDLHLVENRGSGINAMIEVMRRANLEPPRFQDKRSSFWVIFKNHTLMSPEAISWLNQLAGLPLNDNQRIALVYLRDNQQLTNKEYQRLNRVDSVTANRELRGLVQIGLVKQYGTRRWAYYTLTVPQKFGPAAQSRPDEEKILEYVRKHGAINNGECSNLLGITSRSAGYLLQKLCKKLLLKSVAEKRGTRYILR
jgi:ATP-dependent DNA helicase RecG